MKRAILNETGDLKKIEKKLFEKIFGIRHFVPFFSKKFTKRLYKSILSVTPINDA